MVSFPFIEAMLNIVNLIIATFTLVYGIIFIIESAKTEHRITWNFLVLAIFVFFSIQTLRLLKNFNVLDANGLIVAFETVFNGLLLYVFIFQRDLMRKYTTIVIKRKQHKQTRKR